jgi:uncharacterized RDD family membrane protein YckC
VLWLAGFLVGLAVNGLHLTHDRLLFQLYLVLVSALYFVPQWMRGGQTLAMKTWRLRLVDVEARPVGWRRALLRYVAALASIALLGSGFLWALVDRDKQFLHDRLAGTRIVTVPR